MININREGLIKELNEINKQINEIKEERVKQIDKKYDKVNEKERELKRLRKPIYEKYLYDFPRKRIDWIKDIKSSVKRGIKRALNANINQIYEGNLVKIVKELIKQDLEETTEKEIVLEISKIIKEANKIQKVIDDKIDILSKRAKEIDYLLNKEERDKERLIQKNKEVINKRIETELSNLLDDIRGEVEKELVIEALR